MTTTKTIFQCAWCKKKYKINETLDWHDMSPKMVQRYLDKGYEYSHGICQECEHKMLKGEEPQ